MIGPKKVEWMPIANRASSISGIASVWVKMSCQASTSPAAPISMMKTSASFTQRMIAALSRMSANWPDRAESTKNGRMNRPEATRAELRFGRVRTVDAVDDEQHHRVLEQVVVEGIEQLGAEQRQEPPLAQQIRRRCHASPSLQPLGSSRLARWPGRTRVKRLFYRARGRLRADSPCSPCPTSSPCRGSSTVPLLVALLWWPEWGSRLCDGLRALLPDGNHRLFRRLSCAFERGRRRSSACSSTRSPTRSWSPR